MMGDLTTFHIRVDEGPVLEFRARNSAYVLAVMEAFGPLEMPYPCTVEIWCAGLPEEGYGPYFYRIGDFNDGRGNKYGCPSIMTAAAA